MDLCVNDTKTNKFTSHHNFVISIFFKNDEFIGLEAAKLFDEILKELKLYPNNGEISIFFYQANQHIDLCVLGIILLIQSTTPNTKIKFIVKDVIKDNNSNLFYNKFVATIKKYLTSAIIANRTDEIIKSNLNFYFQINEDSEFEYENSPVFFASMVGFSKFSPITLINAEIGNKLFNSTIFWHKKKKIIDENSIIFSDYLSEKSKNINESLFSHFLKKITSFSGFSLEHYVILNYAKLLSELRSFSTLYDDNKNLISNSNISNSVREHESNIFPKLKFKNNRQYLKVIKNIDSILKSKDLMFLQIFTNIALQYLDRDALKDTDRNEDDFIVVFENQIKRIFSITEQLYFGLKEIFYNVLEHSSSKTGVFLSRIYNQKEIKEFKLTTLPNIEKYLVENESKFSISDSEQELYIDINIFDDSTIGILKKYNKIETGNYELKDIYTNTTLTPKHSKKRFEDNIGLLLYNQKIQNLYGYFFVSTVDENNEIGYNSYSLNNDGCNVFYKNGSHYNILLPIGLKPNIDTEKIEIGFKGLENNLEKSHTLSEEKNTIWDYDYLHELNDKVVSKKIIYHDYITKYQDVVIENDDKYSLAPLIIKTINREIENPNIDGLILIIDFKDVNEDILNVGLIVRLLKSLNNVIIEDDIISLTNKVKDIVIVGLERTLFKEIKNFLYSQKEFHFNKCFFFYIKSSKKYYYPEFLFGINNEENKFLNEQILKVKYENNANIKSYSPKSNILIESSLLFNNDKMVSDLDLIIKEDNNTFFEIFATKCLESSIDDKISESDKEFVDKRFQGYKIPDGHFKLGSKIHISDFYYAKRMFQVSDISTKFAKLIVQYLTNNLTEIENYVKNGGITILGYAKYSDLLIYKIAEILQKIYNVGEDKININIVQDVDAADTMYKNKKLYKNILLVIPISSTFSTSFKVISHLQKNGDYNFISPVINVINVADLSAKNVCEEYKRDLNTEEAKAKYKSLIDNGWDNIDFINKEVEVKNLLFSKNKQPQKYFIQVYTNWYNIEDCKICFGGIDNLGNEIKELPLVETDKASVTPQLIFGEGLKFTITPSDGIRLSEKCHYFGHYKIDKKHNLHFIDPVEFLNAQIEFTEKGKDDKVENWLMKSKESDNFKNVKGNITIITPDGKYNSQFVQKVNSILFSGYANVIKYDPANDYISNFKEFYQQIIDQSDYLYYVDDQISTGATFININNFVNSCKTNKNNFDGIISLICRSDDSCLDELNNSLKNPVLYYKYLRLPTVISSHLKCMICDARESYYELAETAALDPTKHYLIKKAQKLWHKTELDENDKIFHGYDNRIDETKLYSDLSNPNIFFSNFFDNSYRNSNLLKLVIENYLYKNDIANNPNDLDNFNDYLKFEEADFKTDYVQSFINGNDNEEINLMLLKVISFSPFINHYHVRRKVFEHIKTQLDSFFVELEESNLLTVNKLRKLKLLLKRMSFLKGNYLIREENIEKLLLFYKVNNLNKDTEDDETLFKNHLKEIIKFSGCELENWKKIIGNIPKKEIFEFVESLNLRKHDFSSETLIDVLYRFRFKIKTVCDEICTAKIVEISKSSINYDAVKYSCRSLKNLEYKRRIKTDFQYFIAHLVKEITHNNEVKAIHLDKVLTEEYKNLKSATDNEKTQLPLQFRQLIRILKIENIGIIKKFEKEIINNEGLTIDFAEVNNYTEFEKVNDFISNDQNKFVLQPLIKFLKNENLHCSENGDSAIIPNTFYHYILLKSYLENDNKTIKNSEVKNEDLRNKVNTILQKILTILDCANIETAKNEMHLIVRTKPISSGSFVKKEDVYSYNLGNNKKIILTDNSFSLNILNGLALRNRGSKQTIFELYRATIKDNWKILKPYYSNSYGEYFTIDEIICKDELKQYENTHTHLIFFRISSIEINKAINFKEVLNEGQAVIMLATNRTTPLKPEKLRYITLLKDSLSKFISHHFLNDSFRQFQVEEDKNDYLTTLQHGLGYYYDAAISAHEKLIYINDRLFKEYNINSAIGLLTFNYPKVDYSNIPKGFGIEALSIRENLFNNWLIGKKEHPFQFTESDSKELFLAKYKLFNALSIEHVILSSEMNKFSINDSVIEEKEKRIKLVVLYPEVVFTLIEFKEEIIKLSNLIALSKEIKREKPKFESVNFFKLDFCYCKNINDNSTIKINKKIFKIIFAEILVNLKKVFLNENISQSKWYFRKVDNDIELLISNIIPTSQLDDNSESSHKGIVMIKKIIKKLYNKDVIEINTETEFSIKIPLNT